ncbi:MAG TPA: class A beta-lactamase [Caulobacteraceae bacterium]|nr:class A beta-lactamase [Caulobacteraceae bacterium]
MSELFSRRSIVAGAAASVWAAPALAAVDRFAALEARLGGRLGVAALDVASGAALGHREGERFAMCSTFKAMAAAAALALVDRGAERLDRFVAYGEKDLLPYAPVAREHLSGGGMRLADLCAAAVEYSDNTAANLVLAAIGGPAGWTGFVRSLGDASSRLDRTEPALNTAIPGDPRDTTTPLAMLTDLKLAALGKVLSASSRDRLVGWMVDCQTGKSRLRAGLPAAWRVADKTGTGAHGMANDIAVAWTPSGPIVIACYLSAERATDAERDAAHAEVGRIVAESFRPHG